MTKHGMAYTPTWSAWKHMKRRCLNVKTAEYQRYGGRGITVCERWCNSFADFLADVGLRPDGMTLDRIDNNGNYEPGNCRWATRKEQSSNMRTNRTITVDGATRTIAEWARIVGMNRSAIRHRLESGWSDRDAVFTRSARACR